MLYPLSYGGIWGVLEGSLKGCLIEFCLRLIRIPASLQAFFKAWPERFFLFSRSE